jgi:hypothetical protein
VLGNRKTWTWSGWVKRGTLGIYGSIFTAIQDSSNATSLLFWNDDTLYYRTEIAGAENNLKTTQVFRDLSAWYHIVLAVDTTQATASDRTSLYINGVQVTAFSLTGYQAQNGDTFANSTYEHRIGSSNGSNYFNGYLTEINFIDGQALTPSSFGETNATTGVWSPIAYAGSYGTNGFYLNFSDNSGVTSTTLGKDQAGSNNWTPNNFSVTAGAGNDSLVDTPTQHGTDTGAGGEVRGNYCTLNPLITPATMTLVNGNLNLSGYTPFTSAYGTLGIPTTGKWYFEFVVQANAMIGISGTPNGSQYPGQASDSYAWDADNSTTYNNGASASYGASASNDVVGCAFDADAGTLTFYTNGVSQGTAFSSIPSKTYFPVFRNGNSVNTSVNFGQRPFAYTAPSGFKALVTTNLPAPTVVQGDDYFNTLTWTGADTGTSRSFTGVGFQPDFVWAKIRSETYDHALYDSVRGAGTAVIKRQLLSNSTVSESGTNGTVYGYLSSFDSDGFTWERGSDGSGANPDGYAYYDQSGATYVAWNWKANGAGASNTDGTITGTVTVSANTIAGISIVTYTGNGVAGATVGHGLGAVPAMIIAKSRTQAGM